MATQMSGYSIVRRWVGVPRYLSLTTRNNHGSKSSVKDALGSVTKPSAASTMQATHVTSSRISVRVLASLAQKEYGGFCAVILRSYFGAVKVWIRAGR